MTEVSEHNDSSILRDFSAEYEQLCSQSKEQAEKIDTLNQEVHSLRNRLQVAERVQAEYQSELDCQQQELVDAKASHAYTLLKLKEDHSKTVQDLESKIECLETDLRELQKRNVLEKEELSKARKELQESQDASPVTALKSELQDVMEELAAGRLACVQHQELNRILLKEKTELLEELSNIKEHLEMTEEKLKISKADVIEQSETIQELQESLAVAQNELSSMKATPVDSAARGNSLFAEVEDKRQAMLSTYSSLTKKYKEMKKDYGAKCAEISRLKLENLQLRRQWQSEAEERENRDVWLNDNYEIRIKELVKKVEDIKREKKIVFVNGDSKILAYAEEQVEKSRREMKQLREEMEWRSSERLNEAKALYLARSEVQTLKAEVMSLQAESLVLRDRLQQANITDIPSTGKTLERLAKMLSETNELKTTFTQTDSLEDFDKEQSALLSGSTGDINRNPEEILPESNVPQDFSDLSCADVLRGQLDRQSSNESDTFLLANEVVVEKHRIKMEVEDKDEEANCESPFSNVYSASTELTDLEEYKSCTVKTEEEQSSPVFVSPSLIKPISLLKAEKKVKLQFNDENELPNLEQEMQSVLCKDVHVDFDKEDPYSKNLLEVTNVKLGEEKPNFISEITSAQTFDETVPAECKVQHSESVLPDYRDTAPRRSILAKISRPSLAPVDQNLMRKVRFAENNISASPLTDSEGQKSECNESSMTEPPKKKLVKLPPTKQYKTRFVISRETL